MAKVAFILGAGASSHLGFPTGDQLISDIIATLTTSTRLAETVDEMYGDGVASNLGSILQSMSIESIDQFMEVHRNDTLRNACRFMVTFKILEAEHQSAGFMHDRKKLSKNWYHHFRQFLLRRPELVTPDAFSFLTFNYDRSLEHFMIGALQHDGRVPVGASQALFDVFHLHGSFGRLPGSPGIDLVAYGGDGLFRFGKAPLDYVQSSPLVANPTRARIVADRIGFPHEKVEYGLGISRLLSTAELVVIIGFRFAQANCDKIFLPTLATKGVPVIATALELPDENREYLSGFSNVELFEKKSDEFFDSVVRKRLVALFASDNPT